jgi:hypothetical protein
MKAAYYREGSASSPFEVIGFIVDRRNAADNKLLLKPFGGQLVAYMGFPDSEFQLQVEKNFSDFDAYFTSEIFPVYKKVPYSDGQKSYAQG